MDAIPNISDSYLIVIGIAEPLLSAELGTASCENGLFFHRSLVPRHMKEWKQELEQNIFTFE